METEFQKVRGSGRRSISRSISRSVSRTGWIMEEVFGSNRLSRRSSVRAEEDEEALKWAAIEKLPTYDRLRTGIFQSYDDHGGDDVAADDKVFHQNVDVRKLGMDDRQKFINRLFRDAEEDNEKYLKKFRDRIDRYGFLFLI